MWDVIVLIPDQCLSIYIVSVEATHKMLNLDYLHALN